MQERRNNRKTDVTIAYFCQDVIRGPEFVCCVCHCLLFRKQVIECRKECYEDRGEQIAVLGRKCITLRYVHAYDEKCKHSSGYSPGCKLWIYLTCHRKFVCGKLPEEIVVNNMHLVDIPNQLKCLNTFEQHLVEHNITLMKLLCLPHGKQHGYHGTVVCVPIHTTNTSNYSSRK